MSATHEDFRSRIEARGPSDRSFGLVFVAFFLLVAFSPLRHGGSVRIWSLILAGLLLPVALLKPALLHAANRAWVGLGVLLGKVVNPVVTALLFYLVFTPCGILLRLMGKDLLGLRRDSGAASYWQVRRQEENPSSMTNQF